MTEVDSFLAADLDSLTENLAALEASNGSSKLLDLLKHDGDISSYREQLHIDMKTIETGVISRYLSSAEEIVDLYNEAEECDKVLAEMESELNGFLIGLRSVSQDIHQLQFKSHDISVHLKEQEAQQKQLAEFIDAIVISPDLIKAVCELPLSELTLTSITELSNKLFSIARRQDTEHPAIMRVLPELEKLRERTSIRIRDFLFGKFEELKQPKTNTQIIQRNVIVKYQGMLVFLDQHDTATYEEVALAYTATMSKIYSSQFKAYHSALAKLASDQVPSKSDVLAAPPNSTHKSTGFALGSRGSVLTDADPITTTEDSAHLFLEQLFRSEQKLLIETACAEFMFLADFFPRNHTELFSQVFSKTLGNMTETVTNDIQASFDVIGLLLSVRVTEKQKATMAERAVAVLRTYHERLMNTVLWPRIRNLLDAHIQSLKKSDVIAAGNVQPHFVTRRFAELVTALLVLKQPEWGESTGVPTALRELQSAYDVLIAQLSKKFNNQDEAIFSLNNSDLLVAVYSEHGLSEQVKKMDEKNKSVVAVFVEGQLQLHFSSLIHFVSDAEGKLARGEDLGSIKETQMSVIVAWFKSNWKTEVDKISKYITGNFSNMTSGVEIMKQVFTQLLLYYTRFQKIINRKFHGKGNPGWVGDLVPSQDIMQEIKQLQNF